MKLPFLYLAALAAGLATTFATLPLWRRWCLRIGLIDEPGERKLHPKPIPLAGGLAVITGLLFPALLAIIALRLRLPLLDTAMADLFEHGLGARARELGAILLGALGMLAVGVVDDKYELRPSIKFICQFLVALLVAAAGIRITLFVPSPLFSHAVTVLWIVTVINAFNFMDNMNGLCAGLGAIAAISFAAVAALAGQYLVALIAALTGGAIAGFLPWNFPQARSFLGDAGSHLIGYLLAVLAILPHFHTSEEPRPWAVLSPLLILAVPLADMAWVVVLRWRLGKPFYIGDRNHLSHRLVHRGFTRTRAVIFIWILAAALSALPILLR